MSEHFFGLHRGHLTAKADRIAKRHDAWHINYTEPRGERRGWFACRNYGEPFDSATAKAVLADIEAAGGFEALTMKQDRRDQDTEEFGQMNSVFHNYDLASLADQLGETKAARRGLELREQLIQQELERRGVVSLIGHEYSVKRSRFERTDPDRDKLKAELGIARYEAEFTKTVPVVRWTCTAVETASRKAA